MKGTRLARGSILACAGLCLLAGCARSRALLEVSGSVMYEKPQITMVSHEMIDSRDQGGAAVVRVTMSGDPGLAASFDVYPGVAERLPMKETREGNYEGEFSFPDTIVGGPFTIVVRLRHEAAGEATWRDPDLIMIPLFEARP